MYLQNNSKPTDLRSEVSDLLVTLCRQRAELACIREELSKKLADLIVVNNDSTTLYRESETTYQLASIEFN